MINKFIIGARICEVRKMRGLKQSELANMAGVHFGAISEYEVGWRMPSLRTFVKLAYGLKVPADYLMGLTETMDERTGQSSLFDKIEKLSHWDLGLVEDFVDMLKARHAMTDDDGETDD